MGYFLKPGLQEAITQFDPSVELLFNNRIGRWVVAQCGGSLHPPAAQLIGCPQVTSEMTHYTPVFVCEIETRDDHLPGQGVPIEPDFWILERLTFLRKYKHRSEKEYNAAAKAEEESRQAEFDRKVEDCLSAMKTDMLRYGKKGDDLRSRRNVTITNNPLAKV